jgi:hypothetical protein
VIEAGGSHELVAALHRVLSDPSVAQFEASFQWAGALDRPGGVPAQVQVEAEAAPLLREAARLLKTSSYTPDQVITGPIVEHRHLPEDPFGEIAVQTVRRGRPAEVRVRLPLEQFFETFEWTRAQRAVLVEGQVRRSAGQPLRVDRAKRVLPLDETYLPAAE